MTWEGAETSSGETQYPVISVVWDDYATEYPDEYIGKCIDAFERFDLPEESYEQGRAIVELITQVPEPLDQAEEPPRRTPENPDAEK